MAAPRLAPSIQAVEPAVRVARLSVNLAPEDSARATVRERNGAVDLQVFAPTAQAAELISAGLPALRRALHGAGLQLEHADVSYRDPGRGRQSDGFESPAQAKRGDSGDHGVFIVEEVKQ
ncbi:MAG: flagellar hook-length control protein FliK [Deltaproteobacteria bacterium]|nr:flagellar hook-length control protein FliK [Deltaproteobacteria bacterium]